jgi:DNA-binding FadR family transcriptional regulator
MPPGTFERVYAAIKRQLRDGLYRPGDRLEPAVLSDALNASVTPVRDALHRLTGERLVEAPRQEGFRVPMMTESRLRQLYAWHRDLLLLAVMKHRASAAAIPLPDAGERRDASVRERTNVLFLALASSTGNCEHLAALEAAVEKLEPLQRLEENFLDEIEDETNAITEAIRIDDRKGLRRSLVRYHRRRERIVPDLLVTLLRG